jgi:low affinity Fe/Cu permease
MSMQLRSVKFYFIHAIVGVIALACFLMNGFMRDGLPVDAALDERMRFIAENHALNIYHGVFTKIALAIIPLSVVMVMYLAIS